MSEYIAVSVVCATQKQSVMRSFKLPAESTVADAVAMACASGAFPTDKEALWSYAIFGQRAESATPLHNGDRIELLLSLRCDPKENRRQRARSKPDRSASALSRD